MAAQPGTIAYISPEDYLAMERQAAHKSEYCNGEVFAMVGASEAHNLIVANLIGELHRQLKAKPCRVYPSDLRVRVSPTGLYTYPDVTVACGELRFADDHRDTLLNPTLIVEVLSDSTSDYDRGRKFAHYRRLDSLQDYLLVEQHHCHVEHFQRQSDHRWLLAETDDLQAVVDLGSIGCQLALTGIYDRVLGDEF